MGWSALALRAHRLSVCRSVDLEGAAVAAGLFMAGDLFDNGFRSSGGMMSDDDWARVAERLDVSPQQAQIMRLIVEDECKPETIAEALGIKPRSVRTQMERLFLKLGVHSRMGVAVRVFTEVLRMRDVQQ